MLEFDQPVENLPVQGVDVWRDVVGQLAVLQPPPDRLDRVQVRAVRGQPFQPQPPIPFEERPDDRALVVGPPVPDDDHLPPQMPEQVTEEGHDLGRGEVILRVGGEVEPEPAGGRGDGDGPDHAHLVPVPAPGREDRGLPPLGPGPADERVEEQPRLIDQDDVSPVGRRFFWTRGQSARTHPATASGFRSRAGRAGFCGLYPRFDNHSRR